MQQLYQAYVNCSNNPWYTPGQVRAPSPPLLSFSIPLAP